MNNRQILDNNDLISEFMGYTRPFRLEPDNLYRVNESTGEGIFTTMMNYHSSWSWLMPVVEKIENTGVTFHIEDKIAYVYSLGDILGGSSGTGTTKMEAVYCCVVKFIIKFNKIHKLGKS
ncbi:MAG: hypothetical protein ACTHMM_10185 [Agriterribacter sp.]